jgi:uncharacterized membrane protein
MPSTSSWRALWERRSVLGLLLAATGFVVSFSPSLLPRGWELQAVAAMLSAVSAYAVGALVSYLVAPVLRWFGLRVVSDPERGTLLRLLVGSLALGAIVWASFSFHQGRVTTARLVGAPPPSWTEHGLAVGAGLGLTLLVLVVVGVIRLATHVPRVLLRFALPPWASRLVSVALVIMLLGWASNQFLVQRTMRAVSAAAATLDQTSPLLDPPTSPLRSGGPGAAQPWEDLGHQGQRFTAGGPTRERIAEVTGGPAAGETFDEAAATLVAELERTGAFERSTLVLVNTTGRGWVDEFNVSAVEYLTGGDSATAALQYSYLSSPVALVSDRRTPREAAAATFRAVHGAWSRRPPDRRPRLYVSGESLGAYGGASVFEDTADLLGKVDGAVWVGTPSFTPMWITLTDGRQQGSPQIAPVVDDGRHVRFVTGPEELERDVYGRRLGPWQRPRVVFMQHPSDPIVWWSPDLAHREPDWIGESAGDDVDPSLSWRPIVTFWQLSLDMVVAGRVAPGHGHVYEDDMVAVWAAVLHRSPASESLRTRIVDAIRIAVAADPNTTRGG